MYFTLILTLNCLWILRKTPRKIMKVLLTFLTCYFCRTDTRNENCEADYRANNDQDHYYRQTQTFFITIFAVASSLNKKYEYLFKNDRRSFSKILWKASTKKYRKKTRKCSNISNSETEPEIRKEDCKSSSFFISCHVKQFRRQVTPSPSFECWVLAHTVLFFAVFQYDMERTL